MTSGMSSSRARSSARSSSTSWVVWTGVSPRGDLLPVLIRAAESRTGSPTPHRTRWRGRTSRTDRPVPTSPHSAATAFRYRGQRAAHDFGSDLAAAQLAESRLYPVLDHRSVGAPGTGRPTERRLEPGISESTRIAEVIAPLPLGVCRLVSAALSARSSAARDRPLFDTTRTRPS